jgi:hypothetical protein
MRLVGYARVSSEGQLDGCGLDVRVVCAHSATADLAIPLRSQNGSFCGALAPARRKTFGRCPELVSSIIVSIPPGLTVCEAR